MKLAKTLIALAVALALQTALGRYLVRGGSGVDLVLVAVTWLGLTGGPVVGMFAGTLGGLAQDALGSGVIGIGGLSKTVVGFLAGIMGTQFIVAQAVPQFFVFFTATVINETVFFGLSMLLGLREMGVPYMPVLFEAIGNSLIGVVLCQISNLMPGVVDRRRMSRTGLRGSRLGR